MLSGYLLKNITMNISKLSRGVKYLLQLNQMGNLENLNLEFLLLLLWSSQWHLSVFI